MKNRGRIRAALSAVLVVASAACAQPASQPAPLVLEGFERLARVRTWPEKLEAVTEGEGVTEGKAAARVPGGQTVMVKLKGAELRPYAWLKFDVLTLQPLSQPFRIQATAPNWQREAHCYAQAGRDTIAMPLAVFFQGGAPEEIEIQVANTSHRAAILDNIRLEPVSPPPPGGILLDFGFDWHVVWPGFTTATNVCPQTVWSGKVPVGVMHFPMPDPLGSGAAGPFPGSKVADTFDLVAPERNCTAWLWITHYAEGHTQPSEYFLLCQDRVLAQRRIARDQLLTADGLMEGMGGEWTPKWYDSVYAGRFVELVKLQLTDARTPVAVGNCQLAALAIAPPSQKAAMTAYVDDVQADLARYRRQFVVGLKNEPYCELNPTEEEAKAGLILLCPPPEDIFYPGWRPKEADRAEKVSVTATGGLLAAVPLAVAPLKRTPALIATVGPLRSAEGRNLIWEKDAPEVLFCKTVPRVFQARADQQPWVLTHKNPPLADKQIAWMVLRMTPAAEAKPGLYEGAIRVSFAGTVAHVPLEVKVCPTGPDEKDVPTVGIIPSLWVGNFYTRQIADDLPGAARDSLQAKIGQQLADCLNAFCLAGVFVRGDLSVADGGMPRDLRNWPVRSARGRLLFDCQQALEAIRSANLAPGSRQFEQLASQIVARTGTLAGGAGAADYHVLLGTFFDQNWVQERMRLASAIQAAGGSAAMLMEDGYLARAPREQVQAVLASAGAVIFVNYQKNLPAWIETYRKARPGGRAYVYCERPDRLAAGFFPAAVGADGAYVGGPIARGGLYNGFFIDGAGLVVLDSDGTLVPTLANLSLQQGLADFLLFRRAEALARSAAASKVAVPELTKTLADLKAAMTARAITGYNYASLRSNCQTRTEVEAWRSRLLEACAKALEATR